MLVRTSSWIVQSKTDGSSSYADVFWWPCFRAGLIPNNEIGNSQILAYLAKNLYYFNEYMMGELTATNLYSVFGVQSPYKTILLLKCRKSFQTSSIFCTSFDDVIKLWVHMLMTFFTKNGRVGRWKCLFLQFSSIKHLNGGAHNLRKVCTSFFYKSITYNLPQN